MDQPSLPNKIKDYSFETIKASIKIYLSVLGPIGTALDEIIFGIGERIRSKRIEEFVKVLSLKIDSLIENKIGTDYFQSDDFYDLTINILNSAVKTNSVNKHQILANIFLDGINKEIRWQTDLSSIFIQYVDDLSENHILIFKYLYLNYHKFEQATSYESIFSTFQQDLSAVFIEKYEFRMYLKDLENKTLFRFSRDINEYGSSGGYIALESYEEVPGITVTTVGERFAKYLKINYP